MFVFIDTYLLKLVIDDYHLLGDILTQWLNTSLTMVVATIKR